MPGLLIVLWLALLSSSCAGQLPGRGADFNTLFLVAARTVMPRYAYITVPSVNTVTSYNVDLNGQWTQTGSLTQATSPTLATPDTAGRFLHFQTTAGATLHWRSLSAGIAGSGGFLATTSSAVLVRSQVFPSYMIGLVQGGGSSLQSYPLQPDGSITAPLAAQDTGTNYSVMTQHPSLPLVYILENSGANIHTSQMTSAGVFSFRSSIASTAASSIAVDPLGRYLILANPNGTGNFSYYPLSSQGIPQSPVSLTVGGAFAAHLAVDPIGRYAYVLRQTAGTNLFVVDMSALAVTYSGSTGQTAGNQVTSLLVDGGGRFLYAAGSTPNGVIIYAISPFIGTPYQTGFVAAAGAPTIGLYSTTRCALTPDYDC